MRELLIVNADIIISCVYAAHVSSIKFLPLVIYHEHFEP